MQLQQGQFFSLKSELDHFSFSAIIMYKNTTIWDHLWPRKLQLFKRKIITSAEAQNQGSPTRRWFYAPPKKQAPFFHEKHFQNFQLWKGIRIHLGIHRIYLTLFFLGFPGSPGGTYVCDVSEAFLEEVDAIDLAISALERFGQAPSVQDEMHFSAFFGVATETWMLRKIE